MRLKKLIAHGFKSFADRTEFDFDHGITGIVGPNGCGKSNVVDAIRWSLGEQRPTKLRGSGMTDVLFNGGDSRKSVSLAEVTLVFDNSSRKLPIDFDEVAVSRRLYRDGESMYLINKNPVRLRDLKELFMDTGVGLDTYSVMEQGRIDAFLSAGVKERRYLFEEAAGISKYRARKKETLRRLQRVEDNLLRVHDIIAEVERELRSVKIAAGKARRYRELTARLKELRIGASLAKFHDSFVEHREVGERIEQLAREVDLLEQSAVQHAQKVEEKESVLEVVREDLSQKRDEVNGIENRLETARERIESNRHRLRELAQDQHTQERTVQSARGRLVDIQSELQATQDEMEQTQSDIESQRARESEWNRLLQDIEKALLDARSEVDAIQAGTRDAMRKHGEIGNRLIECATRRDVQVRRSERLTGRLEELQGHRDQLQRRIEEARQRHSEAESHLLARRDDQADLEETASSLSQTLSERRKVQARLLEKRHELSGKLEALMDLEQALPEVEEGTRRFMEMSEPQDGSVGGLHGLVAELFEIDPRYVRALEVALGESAGALVVDESFNPIVAADLLNGENGRLAFTTLPPDSGAENAAYEIASDQGKSPSLPSAPVDSGSVPPPFSPITSELPGRRLVQLIRPRSELACRWMKVHLEGIWVCEDLASALELVRLAPGSVSVTPAGERVDRAGVSLLGEPTGGGLVHRRVEIQSVEKQKSDTDQRTEELESTIKELVSDLQGYNEKLKFLKRTIYDGEFASLEVRRECEALEQKAEDIQSEIQTVEVENQEIGQEVESIDTQTESLRSQRKELEQALRNFEAELQSCQGRQESAQAERDRAKESLTSVKISLGGGLEKLKSIKARHERLEANACECQESIRHAEESSVVTRRRCEEAHEVIAQEEGVLKDLGEKGRELAGSLTETEQKEETFRKELQSIRTEQELADRALRQSKDGLADLRMKERELQLRKEGLGERMQEEYAVDLSELASDFEPEGFDLPAAEDEIRTIREKMGRLGNVNLDAIHELDALEERSQFLSEQRDDLESGRDQLNEIIRKLNRKSRELFTTAFVEIRDNFRVLFRKLFAGGKADILLTEPEDVLESGIEIVARPPGKEPRSISLLSGGERAMTTIALLFSVFKTRPSPFCVLDEIDAPLDESNIDRFTGMLEDFLEQTQFLIVTHSKRTMSVADVLYGVTMGASGVSKRIAVHMDREDQAAVA